MLPSISIRFCIIVYVFCFASVEKCETNIIVDSLDKKIAAKACY